MTSGKNLPEDLEYARSLKPDTPVLQTHRTFSQLFIQWDDGNGPVIVSTQQKEENND